MSGIYIHIPFCASKCHYCNFFSTVSLKYRSEVVTAISQEIRKRHNYLNNRIVDTIYFGGGTPTVLNAEELETILKAVFASHKIEENAEITVEANPDDINELKLKELLRLGVNRLSIGTQAFDDEILRQLNRRHNATDAVRAVEQAQKAGFDNISIDLIYGIPGMSDNHWREQIRKAVALNTGHISAYNLTVEPGTALNVLIRKKKYPQLNEEAGERQFEIVMDELEKSGFEHYEISNFARGGKYSVHNTNYWKQKAYLGIGPSAHSYNIVSRQWNTAAIKRYYEGIFSGNPVFEKELLSVKDKYNEYVMLSLRTLWGVDKAVINNNYSDFSEFFFKTAAGFIAKGMMQKTATGFVLTRRGKFFADGIASEFFIP